MIILDFQIDTEYNRIRKVIQTLAQRDCFMFTASSSDYLGLNGTKVEYYKDGKLVKSGFITGTVNSVYPKKVQCIINDDVDNLIDIELLTIMEYKYY